MRLWVRCSIEVYRGRFFKGRRSQTGRQKIPGALPRLHLFLPTSGFHSVRLACQTEKKSLPSANRQRHRHSARHRIYICVQEYQPASLSPVTSYCQTAQERLTHAQSMFAWNPSPRRPSRISFEYLLLPPRSALAAVPRMLAHTLLYNRHVLLLI